jgi:hypothetical protein
VGVQGFQEEDKRKLLLKQHQNRKSCLSELELVLRATVTLKIPHSPH